MGSYRLDKPKSMILILPVCEIRIFSILRSAKQTQAAKRSTEDKTRRTTVDDIVLMAIIQRTSDLPCKLACNPFPEPSVADDVIQHLPTVDIFEYHIVVVLVHNHLSHSADIWVMKKHGQCGFTEGTNFLGRILGGLLRGGFRTAC